jgi:hypothetical protein
MNVTQKPADLSAVELDHIADPETAATVRALMQEVESLRRQIGHNETSPILSVEPVSPAVARMMAHRAVKSPTEAALARSTANTPAGCPVPLLRMMGTGPCSIETLAAGTGYASNIVLGAIERLCAGGYAARATSQSAQRWGLTQKGWPAAMKSGALS